ncbi:MAG: ABC transporter ATP-binding protein/permease [Lactococcus plantarum]|nr:ABC transporter ATP-binding protein/permease [Lactococcus plantarum]MDN6070697.1 ABC transporter ATP-binding protein/permease [Lactococcus plantarum]MDN6084032.1 ABC transporter ATP-binding protein/permease [Lactococcus plantarum]
MRRLLKYARDYRKQIILGPFFKFLEAVFELVLPLLMARLIDKGIRADNKVVLWQTVGWMVAMSVIGLGCALICQYYASIASQGFGTVLRNKLMRQINQLSHKELNRFGTDTLITRLTSDINQLQLAIAMLIRLVVRAPFLSVGSVIMAFYIDWQTGLIYLILLPIFCVILYFIVRYSVPLYQRVQKKLDELNELVNQNLSGVRVIRAFARRKRDVVQFNESSDDLANVYQRVTNLSALLSPATTLVMNLGIVALILIGGIKVNTGRLTPGEVLALINYMNQMLLALIVVSNLVVIFTRAAASAARVNEVLDQETALHQPENAKVAPDQDDFVSFEKVDFRYEAKAGLALQDISFSLNSGEFLGITGATGSGKTTLTQLIPRFYDVAAGRVLVNGLDVREWDLQRLRQQMGFVPQTSVLFHGTIRDNLQWGNPSATDDDCWQALTTAQCREFVEKLSEGLDTMVMEGGKNFSGGQKQRLSIARALIRKPRLLILDDSLSALDYQTDLALRQALASDLNSAVIIISQRVRSIQHAKQILVLENGRLVGKGSHDDLLAHSPEYQAIVTSQEETHE